MTYIDSARRAIPGGPVVAVRTEGGDWHNTGDVALLIQLRLGSFFTRATASYPMAEVEAAAEGHLHTVADGVITNTLGEMADREAALEA